MDGQSLGHYRIISTLGSGGMGEVYSADDTILKRRVALKVLPSTVAADPERRARFEREAQTVASLNHPGIVTIYSVELSGDIPFLTMELVEGKPLSESIGRDGMPVRKLLPIAIAVADAMAAAHQRGVVHRDLKPANVMLTDDGRVKILDFGLAKLKDFPGAAALHTTATQIATGEGRILGTVAYMSPEQAEGQPVDARSDIFSLGILLYELAVGERPFRGDTSLSVLTSILRDSPMPITERNAALPRELDRIVRRCLVKDPRGRYQSAADLRNDVEELKQEMESTVRASGRTSATQSGPRSRRNLVMAAVAGVALVGAITGYLLWSRAHSPPPPLNPAAAPAVNPRRIAVTVFENRTGDPSLDSLAVLVAERLIQGLTVAQIGEPVPAPVAATDAQMVRAAVLIGGAFDQHGETLSFQTRVTRGSDGKIIYAPEPVTLPKAGVTEALASLHQNVKAFTDMYVTGWDPTVLSRLPVLEAEREYVSGVELFERETPRAMRHFQRALEIDPLFVPPRLFIVGTYMLGGLSPQAAEALAPLVQARQRLSRYEQAWVDRFVAELDGRHTEALAATMEAEKLAPQDYLVNFSVGVSQLRLNRPAAALATFAKVPDPEWLARVGAHGLRLNASLVARHFLGNFEQELQEARDAQRKEARSLIPRDAEARALIALGKHTEALRVVDDLLTMPGAGGAALLNAVRELRAHGNRQQSLELAKRAVEKYRNLSPNLAGTEAIQSDLARALYVAEEWEACQNVVQPLARKVPNKPEYLGLLGAIAARRGDRARATAHSESLRRLSQPYLLGSHTMWRARIAALLGETASAVDVLRDAISQGAFYGIDLHRDMDLEPLKDDPAFGELMRPKQ
jgi:serine/threonine protein kinase/tetratricopeptide (TPR) repeat protein